MSFPELAMFTRDLLPVLVALIVPSMFTLIDLFQSLESAPIPFATSSPIAPFETLMVKLPPP